MHTARSMGLGATGRHCRRGIRPIALLPALAVLLSMAATAHAAQGPGGRVYEQVSPVEKFGYPAGAGGADAPIYAVAAADGNGLFYGMPGPVGDAKRGMQNYAVGRRSATGWSVFNPFPLPATASINYLDYQVQAPLPSEDLGSVAYQMSGGGLVEGNPSVPHTTGDPQAEALYRADLDGAFAWLSQPTTDPPVPAVGAVEGGGFVPAGGSADLDTFFFSYYGTLVPEDAPRAPNVTDRLSSPWGFYRYANGHLESAGVLPDGTVDPFGAIPAGAAAPPNTVANFTTPRDFQNQVSADGTRALFVSPDPNAGSGQTSQLYVRKDGASTVLVSRSALTGDPAPDGPAAQRRIAIDPPGASYAYGSRDGSHVYFQSIDQLTADAPDDGAKKAYLFDVDHETTQYLPGVQGDVLAASDDLSRFLYASSAVPTLVGPLGVWADGHATTIATRARPISTPDNGSRRAWVSQGRATADGSSFVFQSNSPLPGGFNNARGFEEVYRYDVAGATLSCLSCAPVGDTAQGNSHVSDNGGTGPATNLDGEVRNNRGISSDGSRVFFTTPSALVDRDSNGRRDAYVWDAGTIRLISSGLSSADSYLLDNSASGDDVFFATKEGLAEVDRDGEYDVYDARVGGGFPEGPARPSCPSNCRPSTDPPAGAPAATVTFGGAGNLTGPAIAPATKVTVTKRTVKGRTVTLSIRAPGAGTLSATGDGLRTVHRAVVRAGTYRLKVTLSTKGTRTLKEKRRLRVHILVRYRPLSGITATSTVSLTVKA